MMKKIDQKWFDENRERFDAETTVSESMAQHCQHEPTRISASDVVCKKCHVGWVDTGIVFPII